MSASALQGWNESQNHVPSKWLGLSPTSPPRGGAACSVAVGGGPDGISDNDMCEAM